MPKTTRYLFPQWGAEQLSPSEFLDVAISNGFDGVEINLPKDETYRSAFLKMLQGIRKETADFVCCLQQVFGVQKESPEEYQKKVISRLESFLPFEPDFINSHTGKDHYAFSDNCRIIEAIEAFSVKHNIPVYHEIHRGRFTFHSQGTLPYLSEFPDLKFVGDFSHWCTVSESMLQDQEEVIEKITPHICHLHARVGHEQSPQVNNPFAPEWRAHLDRFVGWWQAIVAYHSEHRGMTITPEFGPFPYMPEAPFSKEPLADQRTLNLKMKDHLKSQLT